MKPTGTDRQSLIDDINRMLEAMNDNGVHFVHGTVKQGYVEYAAHLLTKSKVSVIQLASRNGKQIGRPA